MSDRSDVVEVALEDLVRSIEIEEDVATTEEATALAAAVGAHLSDREAAAAAARESEESTETVDPWAFAGRLESVGARRRRPFPSVERGREWQAASRY